MSQDAGTPSAGRAARFSPFLLGVRGMEPPFVDVERIIARRSEA
jgi:hypothetical protein